MTVFTQAQGDQPTDSEGGILLSPRGGTTSSGATRARAQERPLRRGVLRTFVSLSLVVVVVTSCARYRTIDLPDRPAHTRANRQQLHGLILSSELLLNERAARYQFGPELRDADFFPVIVYLENRGKRSFELQRRDIEVILENGDQFRPVDELEVISAVERSYALAFVTAPLIIPPFIAYSNVSTYNHDLASNFLRKAFPVSLRLEPGDPPQAYALFFRDDKSDRSPSEFFSSVLQARVDLEGTRPDADAATAPIVGEDLLFTLSLLPGESP